MQNLFGNERVDEVEMPKVSYQHLVRVAREVQSGSLGESLARDPEEEIRDLRWQLEQVKRHNSVEKWRGAQCEPAGWESALEEDGKMEICWISE